jgi:translocator protein
MSMRLVVKRFRPVCLPCPLVSKSNLTKKIVVYIVIISMTNPQNTNKSINAKIQNLWNTKLQGLFLTWGFLVATIISVGYTLWMGFPGGGRPNTASISNYFDTPITPAGFTFAIWSLIYVALVTIGILIGLKKIKLNLAGNVYYLLSSMWICLWSVFWTAYNPILSGLALVMIMGFNVATFGQLVGSNIELVKARPRFWTVVSSGFLLYVGWTIVASVLNVTIALKYGFGFEGFGLGDDIWRILVIGVAIAINLWYSYRVRNWTTLAVLTWAIFGIWVKAGR